MIGSVEEFASLCASEEEKDYVRAINDQAPTIVWEEIVKTRPDLAETVATSNTVPATILELVAQEGSWRARYTVAISGRTPGHVLAALSTDPDARVRQAVVSNDTTPLKFLAQLRSDPDQDVADMARLAWQERAERRSGRHSTKADPVWDIEQPAPTPGAHTPQNERYDSFFGRLCAERNLTKDQVVRGFDPRDLELPAPPAGPWVVAPWDDEYVVGTMRGVEFSIYDFYPTLVEAVDQVARLVHERPRVRPAPPDATARGLNTGWAIEQRGRARGGRPGPNELEPGDCLDCFDTDRTHFLFALGTPFAARGQDPAVAANPYHAYQVLAPLPMAVVEGIVAPTKTHTQTSSGTSSETSSGTPTGQAGWEKNGENSAANSTANTEMAGTDTASTEKENTDTVVSTGGAAMVVLDRPLRWYLDGGYLVEIR